MPRSRAAASAAASAAVVASLGMGCSAFVLTASPASPGTAPPATPRLRSAASEAPQSEGSWSAAAGTAGVAAAAMMISSNRRASRATSAVTCRALDRSKTASSAKANDSEAASQYSMAMPWAPVPAGLTNDLLNPKFPGDAGFDPLGFSSDEYLDEVFENFGVKFDKMRWYREAELMHGRVAMLATFNLCLRETPITGMLPDQIVEEKAMWEFAQTMAMLEAFRGYRLFVDKDSLAGDLGLGGGKGGLSVQELADKQFKELQNGRLAMLAIAGIAAQYYVTGRTVGIDPEEIARFEATVMASVAYSQDDLIRSVALTVLGGIMVFDGIRRLTVKEGSKSQTSSIAQKAVNPLAISYGVQDPGVPLPAGVVAGQAGQRLELTEEQIRQYEEDGVIMIKGGMKDWVTFLRTITEYQIERPHVWSLVGRMSGLYDYIQRNMWMTNNGFRDFLYYSPLGHCLAQLGRTDEVRCTTDMLLVNPNKGFGWHQDNQNGPIDFPDAMRWWVAMDKCGENDFGAPEYLLGSHNNKTVSDEAVFVNREDGDLGDYSRSTKFIPEPGDLIIWNARTIHRIVAPPDQCWEEGTQRRAIGGTVAKGGTTYFNKGGASGISDLAGHDQQNGDLLGGPYFPRIYPTRVPEEEAARNANELVGRSPQKIAKLGVTLASNAGKYISFTKVVGKKD